MEKLKVFQPIAIVILICLVVLQFIEIKNLKNEIYYMQSDLSTLQEKVGDRTGIDYKVSQLEEKCSDVESALDDLSKKFEATDLQVSGMAITVSKHDDFIRELETERLFSNRW